MKRNLLHGILLDPDPAGGGGGGGNPPNPPALTADDLHKAVEKARMEERTKLRDEQTALQTRAEAAEKAVKELTAANTALTEQNNALVKAGAEGGKVDVKQLVTEITSSAEKRFADAADQQRKDLENTVQTLRNDLTQVQLDKLRTQLVAEAGGPERVVSALISGSNEEELRASVKAAADAYTEIANRVAKGAGGGGSSAPNNTPPPAGGPAGGGGAGRGATDDALTNVKELSPQEYAAKRQEILRGVGKKFGQAAGVPA